MSIEAAAIENWGKLSKKERRREWETVLQPLLKQRAVRIQDNWRQLARLYVTLPLAFRRDMRLGMWEERFSCAALLQPIADVPGLVNDIDVYSVPLDSKSDHGLVLNEKCPLSRSWYSMLPDVGSYLNNWSEDSLERLDLRIIRKSLDEAITAVQAVDYIFQRLRDSNTESETPTMQMDAGISQAWNTMCDAIQDGSTIEKAAPKFCPVASSFETAAGASNTGDRTRTWFSWETPVPSDPDSKELIRQWKQLDPKGCLIHSKAAKLGPGGKCSVCS